VNEGAIAFFASVRFNGYDSPNTEPMETTHTAAEWESMTTADQALSPGAAGRPPASRSRHVWVLCAATFVVALSFALEVLPGERIAFGAFPNYPLPHACYSRVLFGARCPGCGLTRSFVHLAHGRWRAAWQVHRLGWLLAAIVVFQFPYRAALVRGGENWAVGPRFAAWFGIAVIGLLVANWCWQLWAGG
jgi:hypothetical protein